MGDVCGTAISAELRKVSVKSTTLNDEIGPISPGDETLTSTKEALEIMARLEEVAEM